MAPHTSIFHPQPGPDEREEMTVFYSGPSMRPTFQPGDRLLVRPCRWESIRPGDVVVFRSPQSEIPVVHRVVSTDGERLQVRGDQNAAPDSLPVTPEQLLGRVTHAERDGRLVTVGRGEAGRVAGMFSWARGSLRRLVFSALARPYHWLARSGMLRIVGRVFIRTKVVRFRSDDGYSLGLFWRGRRIGRLHPSAEGWVLEPPFLLFIDPAALPGPGALDSTAPGDLD